MSVTAQTIESMLQAIAPFETAEDYDNVGLLVGSRERVITGIDVMLDVTMDGIREAQENGCNLILSHHPLMFHARKRMVEDADIEAQLLCVLIRGKMQLISAHTNLDKTIYSGSAACAKRLGLQNMRQEGFLFLGDMPEIAAGALEKQITQALAFPTRLYGSAAIPVRTLAIVGGAGDEEWKTAREIGAQAMLTGEVHHHIALEAAANGFALFDGGHYGTEAPLIERLAEYIREQLRQTGENVPVLCSEVKPFIY